MEFNLNSVEGDRVSTGKQIMRPGIHEGVTVTGVMADKTPNGKNVVKVGFVKENGEELEVSWSMEGGAIPYTTSKLKHMLTKHYEDGDKIAGMNTVDKINAALTGKTFRLKVKGVEYMNKEGKVRVKSDIGLPDFCENMVKVSAGASKLKFDETNKYDVERLPSENVTAPKTDDLPF